MYQCNHKNCNGWYQIRNGNHKCECLCHIFPNETITTTIAAKYNVKRTACKADHDMMLYAGVETCPACHQSTRPPKDRRR